MKRYLGISIACFCSFLLLAGIAVAKPVMVREPQQMVPEAVQADIVGNVDGTAPTAPSKALADTVWIGDWSFDSGGGCTTAGWTQYDNRIGNPAGDGSSSGLDLYGRTVWTERSTFSGEGAIAGNAAVLGIHNLCWAGDGYGNNWDYGIKLLYKGATTLDFDFKCDSEACCDFVTVECDSADGSFSRLDYIARPGKGPGDYRLPVDMTYSGGPHGNASGNTGVGVGLHCSASLVDFGVPGTTHAAYIRFAADGGCSHEDGAIASAWGAGLVVDNLALTGGALTYTENFSGVLNVNVSFENLNPFLAFGTWARTYQHITDNDKCTENTSCAWLWTDPAFIAVDAAVAYGPGAAVIHNWLDDVILAPWLSLSSTPSATGTVLTFRRFFGNFFTWSKIAQNWSFRSHSRIENTDTSAAGDSLDCITPWAHSGSWTTGGAAATWGTSFAPSTQFIAAGAREIQLRWRLSDWQYLAGDTPPNPFRTGPGPFNDRIRVGRLVLNGPVIAEGIDNRSQQQDCFATVPFATGAGTGEHFAPSTDRFGTAAFSMCTDLTINKIGPNVVTGDSISIQVTNGIGTGREINGVTWYGKITSGPHIGKAPAPYAIGGGGVPAGFFAVPGDSCRGASGAVIANRYFVDLDDTYFRGGDSMVFFWSATDAGGGFTSDPVGMLATPADQAAAETATGGLKEVNFLPTITWDPQYIIDIGLNGDADPTAGELANSTQKNCILYDQQVNGDRRSGDINRTSMMYTMDRLGYKNHYDVYDQQAGGNTNNQIGGRATVAQATGYAVNIMDKGRGLGLTLPDGINIDSEKVNQAQWYRDYLANGSLSAIGSATLWIVSENTVNEKKTNALIATDMGITLVSNDQGLAANPNVVGQTSFTFAGGGSHNFTGETFSLAGGCPAIRNFDALGTSGTAVATHKYKAGLALGNGAVVMNRNVASKWNTVLSAFGWFDIRDASGNLQGPPPYANPAALSPEATLMKSIFDNTLPSGCHQDPNVTPVETKLPKITSLYQNEPNPFNPTTKIKFDLARDGQVKLRVFDVAGHQVRTLVNGKLAGARHEVSWNGLDDAGRRVSSGVYFYQLLTDDYSATKKMVVLK